jgi:hypothetical protein
MTTLTHPTPDELQSWFFTANFGEVCRVVTTDHNLWLMKVSDDMVQWRIDTPPTSKGNGRYPKLSRYDRFEDVLRMWTGNGKDEA